MPRCETDGRPVASSTRELLETADRRESFVPVDGRSFAPMQRLTIDGAAYVTKTLSHRVNWLARATGEYVARVLTCWRVGVLDALPDCIDHAIVAVAHEDDTQTTTLLMRDVGEWFVPDNGQPISVEQHRGFIDHMATLHAAFWGRVAGLPVLTPMSARYMALTPLTADVESAAGRGNDVLDAIVSGWATLDAKVPEAAALARALAADPAPLVDALAATPSTFIHGDWKLSNLGTDATGRTILVDWQFPGAAPPCVDLAWFLAINSDRIPESKEATVEAYRDALERHGVDTSEWFESQLALALLGGFVQMGWDKIRDDAELDWWAERALTSARSLS